MIAKYEVNVDAVGILAQFITTGQCLTEVVEEAFRSYGDKYEVRKIRIFLEKGK